MDLEAVVMGAPQDEASGLLIWLHGLGADGHDFAPVIPMLERPDLRVILPHAPIGPVTINMGMPMRRWYDIRDLDPSGRAPMREPEEEVLESARIVEAIIEQELAAMGLGPERCVVAGFSQGGAMAAVIGVRRERPLAGIVGLSCYLPAADLADRVRTDASAAQPVFLGHGTHDPMVHLHRGEDLRARLEGWGHDVDWMTYPMQHEVCLPEIEHVADWLNEHLPPPEA